MQYLGMALALLGWTRLCYVVGRAVELEHFYQIHLENKPSLGKTLSFWAATKIWIGEFKHGRK